ncbi:MAG TPA: hypothetical protein VF408_02670 [Sediminibacterium sp.]|jgi:hypothetical protein
MKKNIVCLSLCAFSYHAHAQSIDPVSLLLSKAVKAIDLKVQQLQIQTLRLQQAQQVAEHALSKGKLAEIADWQVKQQDLYAAYFRELSSVRPVVKTLPQVQQIRSMQAQLATEYHRLTKDGVQEVQFDELLGYSRDILASVQELIADNRLSMKDADRVILLLRLRAAMGNCLDSMQALKHQHARIAAEKGRIESDLQFLQKLNRKP